MALFKQLRGKREDLDAQPLHDGYAYFCTDDGTFHIDYADENGDLRRKQVDKDFIENLINTINEKVSEIKNDVLINTSIIEANTENLSKNNTDIEALKEIVETIPTKTSQLENNGEGSSPFVSEEYIEEKLINNVEVQERVDLAVGVEIKKGDILSFMVSPEVEDGDYLGFSADGGQYFFANNGAAMCSGYGWNMTENHEPWGPIQGSDGEMTPGKEYYFIYEGADCTISSTDGGSENFSIFKPQRLVYIDSQKIRHIIIPSMIGALDERIIEDKFTVVSQLIKGRTQAIAFNNYQAMINNLRANPRGYYSVGQSIFIGTLNVPDLWIGAVEDGNAVPEYTYTTDEAFVEELKNPEYGALYINGYALYPLETLKQDLTNYAFVDNLGRLVYNNGTEIKQVTSDMIKTPSGNTVSEELAKKSTIYPEQPPTGTAVVQVRNNFYGEDKIEYFEIKVTPTTWTVARRDENGNVRVGDAVLDEDAMNKKMVSSAITTAHTPTTPSVTVDGNSVISNSVTINPKGYNIGKIDGDADVVKPSDTILEYTVSGKICCVNYAFTALVDIPASGVCIATGLPPAANTKQYFSCVSTPQPAATDREPHLVNFMINTAGELRTQYANVFKTSHYVKGGFCYIIK